MERLTGGQGGENEKLVYKILRRGLPEEVRAGAALSDLTDLALRFDLTVPLTRFFANNHAQLPSPFRSLQIGSVWRAERPSRGRYRQFTQCDIDTLGEPSVLAESEQLEATSMTLLSLSIEPITVRLNDRRLLSCLASAAGVGEAETAAYFVTLDHFDKLGWEGVRRGLAERGFSGSIGERTEELLSFLTEAPDADTVLDRAAEELPGLDERVLADLQQTASVLRQLSSENDGLSFVLDPTIVRGMGYYTGQIFEIAHPSSSSSIAGGGRYDTLIGRSLGREVPACGISIGFERVVDLAQVEPPDLGVAVLYGDEPIADVLAAAVGNPLEGTNRGPRAEEEGDTPAARCSVRRRLSSLRHVRGRAADPAPAARDGRPVRIGAAHSWSNAGTGEGESAPGPVSRATLDASSVARSESLVDLR